MSWHARHDPDNMTTVISNFGTFGQHVSVSSGGCRWLPQAAISRFFKSMGGYLVCVTDSHTDDPFYFVGGHHEENISAHAVARGSRVR